MANFIVMGGIVSSTTWLLVLIGLLIWGSFWSALSFSILGTDRTPSVTWLALGLTGPVGPLVALVVRIRWNSSQGSTYP